LLYAQDKGVAKKILEFHGIHTPVFARSYRGRLDFSHDLEFPVIVKPAREDGSIGIEFNAVVSSIRELMERIDWLHANFDSPVLIEEYVEGREMYVGVLGNENPIALPVVELDLSKLPEGRPKIAGAEVKWAKGTGAYRDTKSIVPDDLSDETATLLQTRRSRLPGARAPRLRTHRHAPAARRPRRRVIEAKSDSLGYAVKRRSFAMAALKGRTQLPAAPSARLPSSRSRVTDGARL
jgi:D-alanine-D-alanine ligase